MTEENSAEAVEEAAESSNAEETQATETKEQEEAQNQTNDDGLAALDAEIEAADKGEEAPKADSEEETETEEESEEEVEEKAEEEKAEEKPKGKQSANERIQEVIGQRNSESERADKAERALEEMRALMKETLTKPKEEEIAEEKDDFDPIDEEAYKRTNAKIAELQQQREADNFLAAVGKADEVYSAKDKNWETKKDAVIAHEAYNLVVTGEAANEEEAMTKAKEVLATQMYKVYKNGKDIGELINNKAKIIVKNIDKKAETKTKSGGKNIDMVELEKLRDSAGAPNNKVASGKGSANLMAEIDAEIAAEDKQRAVSDYI
jgi:hypothetical protein